MHELETVEYMGRQAGYAGLAILPTENLGLGFMSPEYLLHYGIALEHASRLGMKMSLYDEYWFPSGSAGGLLAKTYPEALSRRLDMLAFDVAGPAVFSLPVPPGTLLGAVAMETATKARRDLSAGIKDGTLTWRAPSGTWKVMLFTCLQDGAKGLVDYLDPDAVRRFIAWTYQAYYDRFPSHFGTTIDSGFYDEHSRGKVRGLLSREDS